MKNTTATKALAVITRPGKSNITREDARDVSMRLTQLDYNGTTIEAGLIAHNGAGSIQIEQGQGSVYVLVAPSQPDVDIYQRVKVLVNGVYLSIAEICDMHDNVR